MTESYKLSTGRRSGLPCARGDPVPDKEEGVKQRCLSRVPIRVSCPTCLPADSLFASQLVTRGAGPAMDRGQGGPESDTRSLWLVVH